MAAVDLASLSSAFGEALPLSIAESMACGIPCVVTDIGDASLLVGDTGLVIPPRNPVTIVEAWKKLLSLPIKERSSLGERARAKISLEYNINQVSERYLLLYQSIQ
jgi:glycosyltransferase involved in cell wall biosynthesis